MREKLLNLIHVQQELIFRHILFNFLFFQKAFGQPEADST
jgi:hypothetical protein